MNQGTLFSSVQQSKSESNGDSESARLAKQTQQVLNMLRNGPVTNIEFTHAHILRYSARIYELRQRGYSISTTKLPSGLSIFQLNSQPVRSEP